MKLIKSIILLICVSSCAGEAYLVLGEQIKPQWNGIYFEADSGDACLNVGEKEVKILNIPEIANNIYELSKVVNQTPVLQVWLKQNNQYIAMQMSRNNPSDSQTLVSFSLPDSDIGEFPRTFTIELNMIRQ